MKHFLNQPFSTDVYGNVSMTNGQMVLSVAIIVTVFAIALIWVNLKKQPAT